MSFNIILAAFVILPNLSIITGSAAWILFALPFLDFGLHVGLYMDGINPQKCQQMTMKLLHGIG